MGRKKIDNSRRCYWHSIICYSAPNTFKPLLDKAYHWAYAYHDLDTDDEGNPKPPHYHLLLHFKQARSLNSCRKYILSTQNVLGEECASPMGAYEYLWHKNDADKYQYDKSIVVCHSHLYWDKYLPDIRDRTNIDFIEDLTNGVDMITMAKRYGRDYMKNYRLYEDFVDEAKRREKYIQSLPKSIPTIPWEYRSSTTLTTSKQMEFTDDDF